MPGSTRIACVVALLASVIVSSSPVAAQRDTGDDRFGLSLATIAPELNARLIGVERAQGVLFGALLAGKNKLDEADKGMAALVSGTRFTAATASTTAPGERHRHATPSNTELKATRA